MDQETIREQKQNTNWKKLLQSILIILGYWVIYKGLGFGLRKLPFQNQYTSFLLCYIVMATFLVIVIRKLKKPEILQFTGKSFGKGLLAGPVFWGISLVSVAFSLLSNIVEGNKPLPFLDIMIFILAILMGTGFTEEVLFRGIVQNLLEDMFGRTTRKDLMKAVFVTSFLFGLIHMGNVLSVDNASVGKIAMQSINAFGMGLCMSAIYIRSRCIWSVAAIHGFWDISTMIATGIFGIGQILDGLSSDNTAQIADEQVAALVDKWQMVVGFVFFAGLLIIYFLVFLFLMRKKKIEPLLEKADHSSNIL